MSFGLTGAGGAPPSAASRNGIMSLQASRNRLGPRLPSGQQSRDQYDGGGHQKRHAMPQVGEHNRRSNRPDDARDAPKRLLGAHHQSQLALRGALTHEG